MKHETNQCKSYLICLVIDLESSPWISNCSLGLAEPGILVTHECFIFFILVVAAPQTASYNAPAS